MSCRVGAGNHTLGEQPALLNIELSLQPQLVVLNVELFL